MLNGNAGPRRLRPSRQLSFSKSLDGSTTATGTVSTLTFTIDNSASAVAANNLSFTDNFPAGVVMVNPTNASDPQEYG